jgi:hypothetical protein
VKGWNEVIKNKAIRIHRAKINTTHAARPARPMSTAALVATLLSRGIRMTANGVHLHVDAPRGTLTEMDQQRLWDRLEEVCAIVSGNEGNGGSQTAAR